MNPYSQSTYTYYPGYSTDAHVGTEITTAGVDVGVVLGAAVVIGLAYFIFLKDVFHHSGMELQRRR